MLRSYVGYTWLLLLFGSLSATAQMEVVDGATAPYTPENLIENIFLGDGVVVENVQFEGAAISVGVFNNAAAELGIDRGIVMSTGRVVTENGDIGVGEPSNQFASTNIGSNVSSPNLETLSGKDVLDVTRYTIDFRPTSDTLEFRFIFGSEEYTDYVCTDFNDAFGFFISGPGITGPFANGAQNIALVPGTNLPITVSTINDGVADGGSTPCELDYSGFYIDNENNGAPVFSGFTKVLTARAIVQPCELYTITLEVGDGTDQILDSGVFLEAKSFGTGKLEVATATASLDGSVAEGCSEGGIIFSVANAPVDDFVIPFEIIGTATNGVDYNQLPSEITIPADSTTASLPIIAFEDGLAEGTEDIGFVIQLDPCTVDTFYVFVRENLILPPDIGPATTICRGDTVSADVMDATLPVTLPDPPSFTAPNDIAFDEVGEAFFSPVTVFGVLPTELGPDVIQSVCINIDHPWLDDVDVFLQAPSGLFIELTTDNGANGNNYEETCFTPTATQVIFPGVIEPNSSAPYTGNWLPEGDWTDLYDGGPTNGEWNLIFVDDADGFDTGVLRDWTITFNPVYDIDYAWTPTEGLNAPNSANPLATPDVTTTYTVVATDSYGCSVTDSVTITVLDILPAPVLTCGPITDNCITWEWTQVPGETDGYEISVDGTGWQAPSDALSHTVCGLVFNDTLTLEVRALDDCSGEIAAQTCWTPDCVGPVITDVVVTPLACFGDNGGAIDAEATTPTATITFDLENLGDGTIVSNNNGEFTGLPGGNYELRVGDGTGCFVNVLIEIAEPDELIIGAVPVSNVSCAGTNTGRAAAVVEGGVYPFSFSWSNGNTDSLATDLPAGISTVIVTDANGCTSTDDVVLDESDALVSGTRVAKAACFNSADGIGVATPDGGFGDYTYLWDANAGFQTRDTAFNLSAGLYEVTVTDELGCESIAQLTMIENTALDIDVAIFQQAPCNGNAEGGGQVSATGGSGAPYQYQWSGDVINANAQIAFGMTIGTYTVTVTDGAGCQDTAQLVMTANSPINIDADLTPTTCASATDGQANLTISGGGPNYTYTWSDGGAATEDRNDLGPGTYSVTVSDQTGCAQVSAVTIAGPDTLVAQIDLANLQNESCLNGGDGSASALVSGGTGTYTYQWDANAANQTTATATNLTAGAYTVTVLDQNLCEAITTATISAGGALQVQLTADALDCFGDADATINATVTGATGNVTYNWSPGPGASGATYTNLAAGWYYLEVSDANGCGTTDSIEIVDPVQLTTTISAGTDNCDGPSDGTATVMASGGTGAGTYTYAWSDPQAQQTATATDLDNAVYFVTVTDGNGCTAIDTVDVSAPPALMASVVAEDVLCFNDATGSLTVTASGGTPPYSYAYSDPTLPDAPFVGQLLAGNYGIITVTDANGCTAQTDAANAIITQPGGGLFVTTTAVDVNCYGDANGSISLAIGGGTAPYSYSWPDLPGQTDSIVTGLSVGNYLGSVTDANGCTLLVQSEIDQPDSISISLTSNQFTCNTFTVDIAATVSGGRGFLIFDWDGPNGFDLDTQNAFGVTEAGTYTLTVSDANGCTASEQWVVDPPPPGISLDFGMPDTICFGESDGSATATVSNGVEPYFAQWDNNTVGLTISDVPTGYHTLTVIDLVGCQAIDSVFIEQRPEIVVSLEQTAASCFDGDDGTVTLTDITYGGVDQPLSNYTYDWSDQSATGLEVLGAQGGLGYGVTVTDALGCTAKADIVVGNPTQVVGFIESRSEISCNGGADGMVRVVGDGGEGPYTYQWPAAAGGQMINTADGLSAGTYEVTINDSRNCEALLEVVVFEPAAIVVNFEVADVACSGEATGYLAVTPSGGTAPFTYLWENGITEAEQTDLTAGIYTITITDGNGCEIIVDEEVAEPGEPLSALYELTDVSCFDGRDGRIDVFASGGTQPYLYRINDDDLISSSQLIALERGMYVVQVQDGRGCLTASDSLKINEPPAVTLSIGPDVTIELEEQVTIAAEIDNAIEPVRYQWSSQFGDFLDCDTCAVVTTDSLYDSNSFSLFITDANGCTAEDFMKVNLDKDRVVLVPTAFTPNGDLTNDLLLVHGKEGTTIDLIEVFDRWGERVWVGGGFPINSPLFGWDGQFKGKPAPADVYIYHLEVTYKDGQVGFFSGETTLLR